MSQSKNWCFTLNNYTDEDIIALKGVDYTYYCFGYECVTTKHLQGFIQFKIKKRLTQVKKMNGKCHWEIMRGTLQQAIEYCKKDGDFEEDGAFTTFGERTDLKQAFDIWNETGKIRKVLENDVNIQIARSIEIKAKYLEGERDFKPEVIWIWGKSGIGKSKYARKLCRGNDVYQKDSTKWWDGYDAHEVVILDDFRPSNMRLNELLKLIDRYGHRVEQKGTFRQMLAKQMIFTSIDHPRDMYKNCAEVTNEPIEQLLRRIDTIWHIYTEN